MRTIFDRIDTNLDLCRPPVTIDRLTDFHVFSYQQWIGTRDYSTTNMPAKRRWIDTHEEPKFRKYNKSRLSSSFVITRASSFTPKISAYPSAAAMLAMSTLMMPAATVTTMTNPAPIAIAQPSKFEPKYILSHNPPPQMTATAVVPQMTINKSGTTTFYYSIILYTVAIMTIMR